MRVVRLIANSAPEAHVEVLNYDDMLFIFKLGSAECGLWGGNYLFHHIVDTHGTEQDKTRLTKMALGYRFRPISATLTLSD
jgi:hypothetical protein